MTSADVVLLKEMARISGMHCSTAYRALRLASLRRWYLAETADVPSLNEALQRFERWYWIEALRQGGTITGAARIAGVPRTNVHKTLRRLGLFDALGLDEAVTAMGQASNNF